MFRRKRIPHFYLFGGKGGVGKTSMAAATALYFARHGKKTLIISTDPAHSLSDSFRKRIGGDIVKITKNLYAVEIDPKKAMEEYKQKISPEIERIEMLRNLGLDETFDFAGETPGIDELAAFDKFLQYMQSEDYDVIVFDTAPTGHTLRFLSLPDVLDSWIGKVIRIRMGLSSIIDTFKRFLPFGEHKEGESIGTKHLDEIKERVAKAREILSDPERTTFNLVVIPEAMSIYESERAWKTLKSYGIPVKTVIVNQIVPPNPSCSFCSSRRENQLKRIGEIEKIFSGLEIKRIEQFKHEIHGLEALEKLGKKLYG